MYRGILGLTLAACAPPAHLVLTVEDPDVAAEAADRLYCGLAADDLRRVDLDRDLSFPVRFTVAAASGGDKTVFVEARAGEVILAKGNAVLAFARQGTPTGRVELARVCDVDDDCFDELFCDGTGFCRGGVCAYEDKPCASNFACVISECLEEQKRCDVRVDHGSCPADSYCDTGAGCVVGRRCLVAADCQDGSICNGEEQCVNFHCVAGPSPSFDDGDICTLDGCNPQSTPQVFNVAQGGLDGAACTIVGSGLVGICVAAKGGCVESMCGDGVVDDASEVCDDGADNSDAYSLAPRCKLDCTGLAPHCGDGEQDSGEACDDGDAMDGGNGCDASCQRNDVCGDRVHHYLFEVCDDGNTDGCDGDCAADCSRYVFHGCGDGEVCGAEVCDDGDATDCGACNHDCSGPGNGGYCGDGAVCGAAEACDDGYNDACGTCNADCTGPGTWHICGDGDFCPEFEACDDGPGEGEGWCVDDCSGVQTCGDGAVTGSEECDDQNGDSTDTCTTTCARTFIQRAGLSVPDGGGRSGIGVAASGGTLVVGDQWDDDNGVDAGAAHIFEREDGGAWAYVLKLLAGDGAADDRFGAVSVSGDTIAVGAWGTDNLGHPTGSVYIFERDQGGPGSWGQVREIVGATSAAIGARVSLEGDRLAVGALVRTLYIFERDRGGAENWGEVIHQGGTGVTSGMELSGDTAVITEPAFMMTPYGAAHVHQRSQGGTDTWGEVTTLDPPVGQESIAYGNGASLDLDTAVIGDNDDAAFVFQRDQGGTDAWGLVTAVVPSEVVSGTRFGAAVAVRGSTVLVGAPAADDSGVDSGAAFVFRRDQGGVNAWGQVAKLLPDDGAAGDGFGSAVCMTGTTLVVAAGGRGRVYLFELR